MRPTVPTYDCRNCQKEGRVVTFVAAERGSIPPCPRCGKKNWKLA